MLTQPIKDILAQIHAQDFAGTEPDAPTLLNSFDRVLSPHVWPTLTEAEQRFWETLTYKVGHKCISYFRFLDTSTLGKLYGQAKFAECWGNNTDYGLFYLLGHFVVSYNQQADDESRLTEEEITALKQYLYFAATNLSLESMVNLNRQPQMLNDSFRILLSLLHVTNLTPLACRAFRYYLSCMLRDHVALPQVAEFSNDHVLLWEPHHQLTVLFSEEDSVTPFSAGKKTKKLKASSLINEHDILDPDNPRHRHTELPVRNLLHTLDWRTLPIDHDRNAILRPTNIIMTSALTLAQPALPMHQLTSGLAFSYGIL